MRILLSGLVCAALLGCSEPESVADVSVVPTSPDLVQDRFRVFESSLDFAGTIQGLHQALDRRDLTVFATINHAAAATNVGLSLDPATLLLFGNPRAGTPLMQAEPLMAAELPMRALVYQRGETVYIAMTGMSFLERNYRLDSQHQLIDRIADTLEAIALEAGSP